MPAAQLSYGSVEWFAEARTKIYCQAFALCHIVSATEAAEKLLSNFKEIDEVIASALFRSIVIEYGKPFASSRNLRTYSFNSIKSSIGVDRSMHEELLMMRNKLIAHQDEDFTDRVLLTFSAVTTSGETTVSFPVAIQFKGLLLAGINDEELLGNIIAHLKSCIVAIGEKSALELESYRGAVSTNHENFVAFSEDARFKIQSDSLISDGVTLSSIDLDFLVTLKTPSLTNKNGYRYKLYSVDHIKTGPIGATDSSGKHHEIILSDVKLGAK